MKINTNILSNTTRLNTRDAKVNEKTGINSSAQKALNTTAKIKELTKEIDSLNNQKNLNKSKITNIKNTVAELKNDNAKLTKHNNQLTTEIKKMETVTKGRAKDYKDSISKKKNDIKNNNNNINNNNSKISKTFEEAIKLDTKNSVIHSKIENLEKDKSKLEASLTHNTKTVAKNIDNKDKLFEQKQRVLYYNKNKISDTKTKIETDNNRKTELKEKVDTIVTTNDKELSDEQYRNLEIANLGMKIIDEANKKNETEVTSLSKKVESLKSEMKRIPTGYDEKLNDIGKNSDAMKTLRGDNKAIEKQIDDIYGKINDLKKDKKTAKDDIEGGVKSKKFEKELKNKITEFDNKISQYKREIKTLNKEHDTNRKNISSLGKINELLVGIYNDNTTFINSIPPNEGVVEDYYYINKH